MTTLRDIAKLVPLYVSMLIDSWQLLLSVASSALDNLLGVLALPKLPLLSPCWLFDNWYGMTLETLSFRFSKNRARDAFRD